MFSNRSLCLTSILTSWRAAFALVFETAAFDILPWQFSIDHVDATQSLGSWVIDNSDTNMGAYSVRSPQIIDHEIASMSVDVTVPAGGGTLSFFYKTSTEEDFDYLRLLVDGIFMGEWSGEIFDWMPASAPLTSGGHTITWQFVKDGSVSFGQDGVWVDNITINSPPRDGQ